MAQARDTNVNSEEWETVVEESAEPVLFTQLGEVFIGRFVGEELIEPPDDEAFTRYIFRDPETDDLRAVNQSYKIVQAMAKVQPGDLVRIEYVKNIDGKKGFNPMKDFRVQVKRS